MSWNAATELSSNRNRTLPVRLHTILALRLGAIERLVGALNQRLLGFHLGMREMRDPRRDGHFERPSAACTGKATPRYLRSQPLGDDARPRAAGLGQHEREFLAAVAR